VLALSVNWRDACTMTRPVVAMLNLVCTLGGNRCVLLDTNTVSAGLIEGSIEVSANSLASSLRLVRLREDFLELACNSYMDHTDALLDGVTNSAAGMTARHCANLYKWSGS
jgi:hypothetical protein